MGIDYFVRKLREAVQQADSLKSRSWGFYHLLSAALRTAHPSNPRIENLITILKSRMARAIADADAGMEADLDNLLTVLDAIEFHLDKLTDETV